MTKDEIRAEYLRQLTKINFAKASSSGGYFGNLTTFKPDTTEVTMPVKEYEVLIDAQDALKDMIRGVADGKAVKEAERLKLYQVLVWEYGSANMPTDIVIILAKGPDSARRNALRELCMADPGGRIKMSAEEIKGPFTDGTVISATRTS